MTKELDMTDSQDKKKSRFGAFAAMERDRQAARDGRSPEPAAVVPAAPPITETVDSAAAATGAGPVAG